MDVLSLGELGVEFINAEVGGSFEQPGVVNGPYPSGAAAIFIDTVARLGGATGYIATVGRDAFAQCAEGRLRRDGVDTRHVITVEEATTGVAFRTDYSDGSRRFIFHIAGGAAGRLELAHIDEGYVAAFRWLHVSGNVLAFGAGPRAAVLKAVDIAAARDIPISLDPNLRFEMMRKEEIAELLGPVLAKARVVFPSQGELAHMAGTATEEEGAAHLLEAGVEIIAQKLGPAGSAVYTQGATLHVPAYTVEEMDATGCGDAYGGAFVFALLRGRGMEEAARFANAVGAITATRTGPMGGVESLKEVEAFMAAHTQR